MSNEIFELSVTDDCILLFEAADEFHYRSQLPYPIDDDSLIEGFAALLDSPDGVILTDGKGSFIGGAINPSWINKNVRIAQEYFWWAKDGNGLKLLEAFEDWALMRGADYVLMVNLPQLAGERVEKIYQRRGYKPFERSFVKELY